MKAIVVLFNGDFHSIISEKVCTEAILASILQNTDTNNNAEKVKVSIFEDSDIAKAVANKAAQTPIKKSILEEYCEKIHILIGDPNFIDGNSFRKTLISAISLGNPIILNGEVLELLLSSKKMSKEHVETLSKYNLQFLPELLKEINNLINL